jgi:hypothetical protein
MAGLTITSLLQILNNAGDFSLQNSTSSSEQIQILSVFIVSLF